ncbi:anthranilate phosphoribosyltransferase [Bacillus alkalicellulosilyticus]|uniref:anthranilate phosphoribosyltransferase n=1 Tax=Alkalihalobacterium alkalicellulosilyticum TaxID=1912214 RepID=UPI00099862C9|nr:hypothetical protein [Bacillus alkalicellulosilyticus]
MIRSLLKEVARGKRGSRDLTYDEAYHAAQSIMNGDVTPAQLGAFFTAERMKMESTNELLAFVEAFRSQSHIHPIPGSLDCAGPYDGRKRSFYATLPTAFVLSATGLPVTLHSSPTLPPKEGLSLLELLASLDVSVEKMRSSSLIQAANKTGFFFIPTEQWCPPLAQLRDIRKELGMRTLLNTVEKLLRLSEAPYMAIGIYHGTVVEKLVSLFGQIDVQKGLIIQGMEGSEDITVERRTRGYWVSEEQKEWVVIDPELLEVQATYPDVSWTTKHQAEIIISVLNGTSDHSFYNTVLLNAGVRLWLCQKADSIEQGIYQAKYVVDNGYALDQFNKWKDSVGCYSSSL